MKASHQQQMVILNRTARNLHFVVAVQTLGILIIWLIWKGLESTVHGKNRNLCSSRDSRELIISIIMKSLLNGWNILSNYLYHILEMIILSIFTPLNQIITPLFNFSFNLNIYLISEVAAQSHHLGRSEINNKSESSIFQKCASSAQIYERRSSSVEVHKFYKQLTKNLELLHASPPISVFLTSFMFTVRVFISLRRVPYQMPRERDASRRNLYSAARMNWWTASPGPRIGQQESLDQKTFFTTVILGRGI